MILTVTLNPALDLTYHVDGLRPRDSHRVSTVAEHPGGKGLNVARVLRRLGENVVATGLLGGRNGEKVAELLAPAMPHAFTPIAGETRRTVVIADGVDATGFWEPGPEVAGEEWTAFREKYRALLRVVAVAVLSGSLPRGVPDDAYAELVATARAADVPVVLDTSGPALLAALPAGPTVVKPNAAELAETGGDATGLRTLGAGAVLASRGADGITAVTPEGAWHAAPPRALDGNPTGAGDAAVAAVARGFAHGLGWPAILRDAVAASAAAVVHPHAGDLDVRTYLGFRHGVRVTSAV